MMIVIWKVVLGRFLESPEVFALLMVLAFWILMVLTMLTSGGIDFISGVKYSSVE